MEWDQTNKQKLNPDKREVLVVSQKANWDRNSVCTGQVHTPSEKSSPQLGCSPGLNPELGCTDSNSGQENFCTIKDGVPVVSLPSNV